MSVDAVLHLVFSKQGGRDPGCPSCPSCVRINTLRDCCEYDNESFNCLNGPLVLKQKRMSRWCLLLGASMSKTGAVWDIVKYRSISCRNLPVFLSLAHRNFVLCKGSLYFKYICQIGAILFVAS